jgi:tetratricopeptide (TPR) repeat protein
MVIICQNLANALNVANKYNEVHAHCENALKINPKAFKALYQRSIAKEKAGDLEGAKKDIKEAI